MSNPLSQSRLAEALGSLSQCAGCEPINSWPRRHGVRRWCRAAGSADQLRVGGGVEEIVGFGDEGVWVSQNRGDGRFDQAQLVCRGFGYNDVAGAWRVDRHPRYLADITGDGRVDIIGFGGPGVYVARNLYRRFRTR